MAIAIIRIGQTNLPSLLFFTLLPQAHAHLLLLFGELQQGSDRLIIEGPIRYGLFKSRKFQAWWGSLGSGGSLESHLHMPLWLRGSDNLSSMPPLCYSLNPEFLYPDDFCRPSLAARSATSLTVPPIGLRSSDVLQKLQKDSPGRRGTPFEVSKFISTNLFLRGKSRALPGQSAPSRV